MRTAAVIALALTGCGSELEPDCFEGAPLAVRLEVDPTLTPLEEGVWLSCTQEIDTEFCGDPISPATIDATFEDGLIVIRAVYMGFVGWWPWIEIDQGRSAARVCAHHYSDVGAPEDALRCDPPVCAVAGRIAISRVAGSADALPGIGVELNVTFENGGVLSGQFRIPPRE